MSLLPGLTTGRGAGPGHYLLPRTASRLRWYDRRREGRR